MVLRDPLTGGPAAAGAPRTSPAAVPFRHAQLPRAMPPRMTAESTYTRDLGPLGGDPAARMARTEAEMTHAATTVELDAGGPRTTGHLPGYTGFQCATKHNARAVEHSAGAAPRRNDQVCRGFLTCVLLDLCACVCAVCPLCCCCGDLVCGLPSVLLLWRPRVRFAQRLCVTAPC